MNLDNVRELANSLHFGFRHKVPQIIQTEAAECGLACLAMVCGYHGKHVDLQSLRQRFGISSRGATLRTLMDIATSVELKSRALKLDIDELNALKTPCILHWDLNHFVVLVAVKQGKVIIHDPAFGQRSLGIREVSEHFTGVALELWPDSGFTSEKPRVRLNLRKMMGNVSGLIPALTKIFCLSLIIESVNLLLPVGMQLVMDHVIPAKDPDLLTLICLGLLFFIIFRTGVSMLRAWTSLVMSTLIDVQWKARLFDHLLKLPLDYFEKRKLGDIQSRFTSLDTLRTTLTTNVVNSIIDGIMSIGLIVMMVLYGGWLIWVILGFTAIYVIFRLSTYNAYRQVSEEQIVKSARAGSHFMETLYGISTLKALGLSKTRANFWLNMNIDNANATVRKTKFEMMFTGGNTLIATLDQVALLWLGASQVIDGHMTLGMFVAFNTYRGQFSERAANLLNMVLQLRMLSLHRDRIADIALTDTEKSLPERQLLRGGEAASLDVRDLVFQYDSLSAPLINGLNLSVAAGESVAIVGPSGQGKTTLMKIMTGLLAPTQGRVLINGMDITTAGLNNYRSCIACVLQDDTLFAGSIGENIASFDEQKDEARIVDCARRCNIHADIEKMPMGYETLISELGNSLSGGQKQRLLIARALYRRPAILFLDEATSHLDLDNESKINQAIRELDITRIFIAHRPSTIETADRVIKLG
ncbi:MAG: peptidase domain-containing ABC transporter [Ewingella americana]|jgi:ATP-binding cassette subfamily B protein RaxB|uniref:peptidase domain-containing ABC transporter n=1 Tax=Ewingella americana TaxID=41202 RepID=UPI00242EA92E|nr:peptidase domain-containing ABC transporter [Ewingella americana]MCI1679125.1 peptidase domain-containing ABC transporter [Ewingella americana]MCI1852231.1 peptidase domain-containing ABC transporter [Ewingella americana]MCI1862633.1 peptidase domain-containing ABC transporter [Ewingella americana]MCI2142937.1 peptidase domain-containing ABC transporter [Ewingella americana]MCI2163429.1 peptidase domain-containing ABC transporter [Ewingella americana]